MILIACLVEATTVHRGEMNLVMLSVTDVILPSFLSHYLL